MRIPEWGSFSLLVFTLGEVGKLLPHMLQFTDEHREEGEALQADLVAFQDELSKVIEVRNSVGRELEYLLSDGQPESDEDYIPGPKADPVCPI